MGKTTFVLSMARNMAIDYGMPGLIFVGDGICSVNYPFDFIRDGFHQRELRTGKLENTNELVPK
jgi:replicative DNA helicase